MQFSQLERGQGLVSYALMPILLFIIIIYCGIAFVISSQQSLACLILYLISPVAFVGSVYTSIKFDNWRYRRRKIANPSVPLVNPAMVDMNKVIADVIKRYQAHLNEKGIVIQVADNYPAVFGMRFYIEPIFNHLLTNAIKYIGTPAAPTITIRGENQGNMVRFEVADNGMGIPEELQSKAFRPFTRFAPTTAPGLGLGLPSAVLQVRSQGGEIGIESQPGQGTTVWFTLPAASAQNS